ncbi:MAG: hypothetical protein LBD24_09275 [Spirochaetaceae bacterium]|jgi:hypothetical protein|nr:hypothetical protein [Spirochaetaceae bacterium]
MAATNGSPPVSGVHLPASGGEPTAAAYETAGGCGRPNDSFGRPDKASGRPARVNVRKTALSLHGDDLFPVMAALETFVGALETNVFTLEIIMRGTPNNDKPLTTHDNAQLTNRRRLREAEPRLSSSQPANRTGCCTAWKQQAAMLKQPEAGRPCLRQPEAVDGVGGAWYSEKQNSNR